MKNAKLHLGCSEDFMLQHLHYVKFDKDYVISTNGHLVFFEKREKFSHIENLPEKFYIEKDSYKLLTTEYYSAYYNEEIKCIGIRRFTTTKFVEIQLENSEMDKIDFNKFINLPRQFPIQQIGISAIELMKITEVIEDCEVLKFEFSTELGIMKISPQNSFSETFCMLMPCLLT